MTEPRPAVSAETLDELRHDARHERDRLALYRARIVGSRPTSPARLRELERWSSEPNSAWPTHCAPGRGPRGAHDGPAPDRRQDQSSCTPSGCSSAATVSGGRSASRSCSGRPSSVTSATPPPSAPVAPRGRTIRADRLLALRRVRKVGPTHGLGPCHGLSRLRPPQPVGGPLLRKLWGVDGRRERLPGLRRADTGGSAVLHRRGHPVHEPRVQGPAAGPGRSGARGPRSASPRGFARVAAWRWASASR